MQPKLVNILIKIFAYAFTPYSKWHLVVQFYHMMKQFIFHKIDQGVGTLGEEMLKAAHQELFTTATLAFIAVVVMHFCYGEELREAMRKSKILPMVDEPKLTKWGRRIILLTRH
jgi:hypothetical protein